MFWELYQTGVMRKSLGKADAATVDARQANRTADSLRSEIQSLHRQIDGLNLACQAMWEMVGEKLELTQEELTQRMTEIDGRDGKLDGRISTAMRVCPKCDRPNNSKRSHCLYCGTELPRVGPFAN